MSHDPTLCRPGLGAVPLRHPAPALQGCQSSCGEDKQMCNEKSLAILFKCIGGPQGSEGDPWGKPQVESVGWLGPRLGLGEELRAGFPRGSELMGRRR